MIRVAITLRIEVTTDRNVWEYAEALAGFLLAEMLDTDLAPSATVTVDDVVIVRELE